MILTETGEVGVHVGDSVYVLRPSLYAMTQIGEPAKIVEVYATVMFDGLEGRAADDQFADALMVIHACSEEDLCDVFGCYDEQLRYKSGAADPEHVLPLARCLLRHGVTGVQKPLPRRADDEPEFVREFVARDHVALAVAHLGVSEREAWQMTMTSLVGALRAKFPPAPDQSPGARAPTKEEHEATEEWFARIEEKRRKRTLH
ncbi:DUF6246 family protein [Stutzerimonas nitrititolerans]|uniref:DUF6246 family protein n=1 Tax=Stutzerimonas nitrititolerans TaxID=2482751 RepID=UPI0028AE955D|nr:DUF6246 family protein [Stutzerimonas nitrititolerans]